MNRREQIRHYWLSIVAILAMLGIVLFPTQHLVAQDAVVATGPSDAAGATVDDASFMWQLQSTDAVEKDATSSPAQDDADKSLLLDEQLYIPNVQTEPQAEVAHHNGWHTVMFEGFEGAFPAGCWSVRDNNGAYDGSHLWDDTATGAYVGSWSAHPNDGAIYRNIMDTHMRCGPLNLQNVSGDPVTAARLTFRYWLDTEASYDFFSWEYSCNGITNWTAGQKRSGFSGAWVGVTTSLNGCIGSANVYIRFHFSSDNSVTDNGVWVDQVRVEKFY